METEEEQINRSRIVIIKNEKTGLLIELASDTDTLIDMSNLALEIKKHFFKDNSKNGRSYT